MPLVETTNVWSAAAMVIITVAFSSVTVLSLWEHKDRAAEHVEMRAQFHKEMAELICVSKLNVFLQTRPKDPPITWQDIPSDYWNCMPRNLVEERKTIK